MAKIKSESKAARRNTRGMEVTAASKRPSRPKPRQTFAGAAATTTIATQPRSETKQGRIIELLQREGGAGLADLVAATGWLPHTTRAALTRLRQGGHTIVRSKDEAGGTVYCIAQASRAVRSRGAA